MQIPKNKSIRTVICISFATVFLLSFGLTQDAFAVATNQEYQPPQPNAFASYNNGTNQVEVNWNFNATDINGNGAPTTCFLKGDIWYYDDLNTNHDETDTSVTTYSKSFTPLFYSPFTATPVTYLDAGNYAEIVDCTGDMRIDIDTIMNHSQNINNWTDLQIFLTFYAPDADGNFNIGSQYRIDEVFVMYTPNLIFDQAAYQTYGCNGQIGSTLYVDASGSGGSVIAHGDNGDNCGDHLYLENNQYVDIGMDGAVDPFLNDGATLYDYHDGTYSLWFVVHYPYESEYRGSSCADCVAPTFGKDDNDFLIVTNGFTYNGNSTDVTGYYTEFPLITVVTNQTNTVTVKVFENRGVNNIKLIQFGLGMPEIGSPLSKAQTLLEFSLDNTEIDKVVKVDKNNLVDIINATTNLVGCKSDVGEDCLQLSVDYIYRDQPKYNIMAINAIDFSKNTWNYYLNDGIEVIGDSLNEPLTQKVTVSQAGAFYPQKSGSTTLTLSDYKTDTWIDEYGYIWSTNEYGPYLVDIILPPEQTPDMISPWSGYSDRLHSEFGKYVKMQQEKASIILDEMDKQERNGLMNLHTIPDNKVVYDRIDRDDQNLSQNMIKEAQRVLVEYEKQNNPTYFVLSIDGVSLKEFEYNTLQ